MELTITKGRGYVSADKNKSEDLPIGVIAIDSIYTPIERVNLAVENTRVGQITDFDKLTLDVYTNGTLAPDEAVSLAAKAVSYTHLLCDYRPGSDRVYRNDHRLRPFRSAGTLHLVQCDHRDRNHDHRQCNADVAW